MKKKFSFFSGHRRWLSIVMIVSVIMSMIPSTAFAETLNGSQLNPNPDFTVQYYGNISMLDETGKGALTSLSVINTDALNGLPQNGVGYMTTDQRDDDISSIGKNLSAAPAGSEKIIYLNSNGKVMMTKQVTQIYKDKEFKYSSAPNLASLDIVTQDGGHYNLKEIWVLKDGKKANSTNRNDWDIYTESQMGTGFANVRFTNTTPAASATNQIQIREKGTLRFVYDQNTSDIKNDVTLFDYDITNGKLYASDLTTAWTSGTKYVKSYKQGINSTSNYKGTGAPLAFGNSNTTKTSDADHYDAYFVDTNNYKQYLNRYNASWTSAGPRNLASSTGKRGSLGCTFKLVSGISNLSGDFVPVFNSKVTAPDLFSAYDRYSSGNNKVVGKTTVNGYKMEFDRTGDTYVLTSVMKGNKGVDELDIFKDDYPDLYSNNFWPLDDAKAAGEAGLDPLFGVERPKYGAGENEKFPPSDDRKYDHNNYFGLKYQVEFSLAEEYVGPLEYLFYGDDDMWVFLDNKLICDIGGVHSSVGEYVNLWDYVKADGKTHTLTIFYTERGASGSTCYTMFTLPSVTQSLEEVPYGSLKVEKDVAGTGAPADAEFEFTVNLTDKSGVQLTDIYPFQVKNSSGAVKNYGVITEGVGNFKLKDGDSIKFDYIPAGAKYTVVETANTKYDTTIKVNNQAKDVAGGSIAANATQNVKFTNKFKTGDLKVTKVLDGNATSPNDSFGFKVELSDKTITGTYGDMSFEKGVATFNLTGGTSKTAKDLPENVTYTVTETNSGKYTLTGKNGDTGTIVYQQTQEAKFTNTYNTGNLEVSKTVAGNYGDTEKEFTFTVTLDDATVNGTYGEMEFKNGVATFTLKHNQKMTATGLKAGIGYTVTEDADGYTSEKTGDTGTIIAQKDPVKAAFTNTFNGGDLKVSKTVTGNSGDRTKNFNFTVTLDDATVNGTYGDMTFTNGVATFTLKHNESKTATGLKEGIGYTVTEEADGIHTTSKTGDTGTINKELQEAAFINNHSTGSLKVTKTIVSNSPIDKNAAFTFTVTLSDKTVNGTYGDMTFTDGVATFTLKHGESKTASGIEPGIKYTVEEADAGIYTVTKTGDKGEIIAEEEVTAAFTNTYNTGGLSVSKTISSNSPINKNETFHFVVTLDDETVNGTYGEMEFKNGVAEFDLVHGATKTATDMHPGIKYTVTETNPGKYTVTSTGATGKITEKEVQQANFVNTYNTGGLTVSKTVAGNSGNRTMDFQFRVVLSDTTVNGTFGSGDTAMTFVNGVAEFTLRDGQSKTATDMHPGIEYTVTELNPGLHEVTKTGDTGKIVALETKTAAFTNTYNTGALTVSKTVRGNSGDTTKDFKFRVVLSDTTVNGTFGEGVSAIEFKNGVAEFTLKHGESKTATGLHPGITYEVTELDPGLHKVTATGETGTITALETKEAAFINTYNTGGLTVKKFVAGNACDETKYFSFKVELSDKTVNGPYGEGDSAMLFEDGVAEFQLKHGESKTATGLHPGIEYTVTELDPGIYEVSKTGDTGVIEEVKVQSAVFTNTYDTGGLTVKKTVAGNSGDKEKAFNFKVELSDTSINGPYGDMVFVDGVATFTLKHGEMKIATGLHPGTGYTVTELDPGVYTVTKTGETGSIQKVISQIAHFTNTYNTGGLEVSKTVDGNAGERQKEFTFQVVLDDTTVNGPYGQMFFENGVATFTLHHRQSIKATDLHPGTGYTVTELDPGIHTVSKTGDIGTIEELVVKKAEFTNTYNTGGLKITKTINGNACNLEDTFPFRLELSDGSINGTYGDLEFTYGVAEFTLGHEQSVTVTGLHPGTTYTVTETNSGVYNVAATGDTGTIEPIIIKEANFINSYNTGDLVVSKLVAGNSGDQNAMFSFKVELNDASVNGEYGGMTFVNGEAVFMLKHGESRTAEGLESGLEYTVTELNSGKYTVTSTGETGVITQGVPQTAVFTNTYDTGSLAVTKTVDGNAGDTEKNFRFTITLSDNTVNGVHGDMNFIGGVATFTLKHGETKTATGLDDGVTYTVTEEADGIHTVTSVGETGTIAKLETSEAHFTNTYHTGRLTVSKTVGGSGGDTGKDFGFRVELDDTSINGEYGGMSFVNGVAEFTLAHGQSKTASDLPAGTMYTVTETNNVGYSVTSQGATGIIPENNGEATADFYNYRDPGAVNVTLNALKVYNDGTPNGKVFAFELKDAEGNVLQTKGNDELGNIVFDPIRYTEPGTHTYTITEVIGNAVGMRYDHSVYTVTVEVAQDGLDYGASVTLLKDGEPFSGTAVFENHMRSLPPVTECSVTKVWADNDNAAGMRPASVTVQLMSGDYTVGVPITLSEANGWSYTWTLLAGDTEYYVAEVEVPEGYASVVTGSGNNFTVINTYTELPPPPEDPIIEPEDPKPPTGGKEPEDPLYDLEDDDVPQDYLEVEDPKVPKTEDSSNVNGWMLVAILSGVATVVSAVTERKKSKKQA